jgi:lactate dehydrogenase-like 2-hydroxyacid dehydrogenase
MPILSSSAFEPARKTRTLINAAQLAAMKRGAILVNIARGMLIDEAALVDSVTHGQISAAGTRRSEG